MSGRPALPRPKRGGEEFARSHKPTSSSSKKARFDTRNPSALAPDAPEEDVILDADEVGKRGNATKRNAVNIDGYDSDSSNEGFDARADAKVEEQKTRERNGNGALRKSKQEEENDMFADLDEGMGDGEEDEELVGEGKKKDRKAVRFMAESEIEGQDARSKGGGHVAADFRQFQRTGRQDAGNDADSSSESDISDAERADAGEDIDEEIGAGGKKEHAPKLDAFNVKAEKEEGGFDESGNYVRKAADPDAVHDSWLEGVSKKDMKRAKEAANKRDEEQRQRNREDDAVLTSDVLAKLIPKLARGETVLEALARLGKGNTKKKPKWQKKRRNNDSGMDVDQKVEPEDPVERRRREDVESITSAADQLLTRGQTEIYDAEKELLVRQYRRETGEEWVEPSNEPDESADHDTSAEAKQWEYRWADARDGGKVHGPYEGTMMVAWNGAGYFGEGVEFRRVGEKGEWSRIVQFV